MSRETWASIKNSKSFYVSTYRLMGTIVIFSLFLNLVLSCGIYYCYFHMPKRTYYATNGVTPPVELTPLDAPNESSVPLLPPDPTQIEQAKVIPQ